MDRFAVLREQACSHDVRVDWSLVGASLLAKGRKAAPAIQPSCAKRVINPSASSCNAAQNASTNTDDGRNSGRISITR